MALILIVGGCKLDRLKPRVDAGEHRRHSKHDSVPVHVLPGVVVALHCRAVARLVDAARIHLQERRLEQRLGAPEQLFPGCDDVPILMLVRLIKPRRNH